MSVRPGLLFALLAAACIGLSACGPIRLDQTPHIRGTLVTVEHGSIGITHKTGQTYQVEVTRDTTIVNSRRPGDLSLCPGQRATVFLIGQRRFTASSIALWSGECK